MSGRFDPYHKWLGIPAQEQPPNYYRLLGIEPFEEDLDAIECAADRLIKYVRDAATVEQRKQAREILDELSAAKRCLLIVEQKRAYDAGLRAGRATTRHSKRAAPARQKRSPAAVQVTPVASKTRMPRSQPQPKQPTLRLIVIAVAIALIGAGVLGLMFLRGDSKSAKRVAKTPEASKTSDTSARREVAANVPAKQALGAADDTVQEPEVNAITPDAEEPAVASSLPAFVGQTPPSEPISDNIVSDAELIDSELPPPVIKSAASPEPPVAMEGKPEREPPANHDSTGTAERGGLLREVWNDVTGNQVEPFLQYVNEHPQPNQTDTIDRFETPEDFDDQYGQRIRGYVHPPATGNYEFSIRANAEGWLYVSTDAMPENKRRVEPGTKIEFEAGQAYYVEAFHKESSGRDYLSIGWQLPDGTEEKPIPGERLSVHYRIAPRHESEFVVLAPLSAESSTGTKLELIDNGVILATGPSSNDETYRLTFESEMETITAVRLEAISHESLPASGPGRGIGGRFALAEMSMMAASRTAPDTSKSLSFASAVDDSGNDSRRIVDGDEKTIWRASGRGEQAAVTLIVQDSGSFAGGVSIEIELKQREALGCLRLLATSAADPRSASLPSASRDRDEPMYLLFVNLGGDDFTTPDGVRWRASKFFDNETFGHEGGRGVSEDLIANKVQGTAQRGITAFRAFVPEGTYEVTLYFCEYWSTTPSSRRFAIAVEQRVVVASLDLFQAAGGFAKPLVYPIRNVTVTDGRLDVQFRETSESASTILNAIRIQQVR